MAGDKVGVALAVSGSVAAHRALDLTRELDRRGVVVTVLMTPAACRLVTPLFFQAISRRRVYHDLFAGGGGEDPYDHLQPAREARVMCFAPATADLVGRLACGLADDVVTTCALAFDGPRVLAPAMNWRMWRHPLVQRNLAGLKEAGYRVVEPEDGDLACGEQGPGRMARVERVLEAVLEALPDGR